MALTPTKKVLFSLTGVLLILIVVEAVSTAGYFLVRGERFSSETYRSLMARQAAARDPQTLPGLATAGQALGRWPEVIHPYLGFVPDPGPGDGTTIGDRDQRLARSPDRTIVGVFGGSFAGGLCGYGGAQLHEVLQLPGRQVQLLCVGPGGFKQPQQLLALTYLLSLGASFDVVINIDGFNEVTLPALENVPQGVFPAYPRGWYWRVGNINDPEALRYLGALFALDLERQAWANIFLSYGLYRSVALSLVWENWDRSLAVKRDGLVHDLDRYKVTAAKSYAATGPRETFDGSEALYEFLARIWRDSSVQMKHLCDANGIAYYHFLQPNQYVPGSKAMTAQEANTAVVQGNMYQAGVVAGYPILKRIGHELTDAGVRFHDLTMLFEHVEEPLYSDDCCHLNRRGYELVAQAIGESIHNDLAAAGEPPPSGTPGD